MTDTLFKAGRRAIQSILRNHPNDIPDCFQQARLKAHLNLHNFRHDSSFSTWFYRIAVRTALTHIRSHKFQVSKEIWYAEVESIPGENIINPEKQAIARDLVEKIFHSLRPKQQLVIMRIAQGSTMNDLAAEFGMTLSNAKSFTHRTRRAARNRIAELGSTH